MSTQQKIEGVENDELRPIVVKAMDRRSPPTLVVPIVSPSSGSANRVRLSLPPPSGLLTAFDLIARRGVGGSSWAAPLGDDPIAFLLDSISDAANLWSADGALLCRNRASIALGPISAGSPPSPEPASAVEAFSAQDRCYERRYLHCRMHAGEYVLEVIRELTHY
jgi:hypothetical protein